MIVGCTFNESSTLFHIAEFLQMVDGGTELLLGFLILFDILVVIQPKESEQFQMTAHLSFRMEPVGRRCAEISKKDRPAECHEKIEDGCSETA